MAQDNRMDPFVGDRIPQEFMLRDSRYGAVTLNEAIVPIEFRYHVIGKKKGTVEIRPANGKEMEEIVRMSYREDEIISFNTIRMMAINYLSGDAANAVFLVWRYGNPGNYRYSYFIKEIRAFNLSNNLPNLVNPENINIWVTINYAGMIALF